MIKRFLNLILFVAIACVSASAAVDWTTATNLALNRPVTVSSFREGPISNIVDESDSSWWNALKADLYEQQWFFVDLESVANISDVSISWTNCQPFSFDVYILNSEPDFTPTAITDADSKDGLYNELTESWLNENDPIYSLPVREVEVDNGTDEVSFDQSCQGQYVLVKAEFAYLDDFSKMYGIGVKDFKVAGVYADYNEVAEVKLSLSEVSFIVGESASVTLEAFNKYGDSLGMVTGAEITVDKKVTVTESEDGVYTFSASDYGVYDLKMHGSYGELVYDFTGAVEVVRDWTSGINNIALVANNPNAKAFASSETETRKPSNLNDDNEETIWRPNTDHNSSCEENPYAAIDFGVLAVVDAFQFVWTDGGAWPKSYKVYSATETDSDGQPIWNETPIYEYSTENTEITRVDSHEIKPTVMRFIKVQEIVANDQYTVSIGEFRVNGTLEGAADVTEVKLSKDYLIFQVEGSSSLTIESFNKYGSSLGLVKDATVEIDGKVTVSKEAGVYTFTSSDYGVYDFTISGTAGEKEFNLTGTVEVTRDWTTDMNHDIASVDYNKFTQAYDGINQDEKLLIDNNLTDGGWRAEADENGDRWFYIDLGTDYNIDAFQIVWGSDVTYSTKYQVFYAVDETMNWQLLYDQQGQDYVQMESHELRKPVSLRYIKFVELEKNGGNNNSLICEFRVNTPDAEKPAAIIELIPAYFTNVNKNGQGVIQTVDVNGVNYPKRTTEEIEVRNNYIYLPIGKPLELRTMIWNLNGVQNVEATKNVEYFLSENNCGAQLENVSEDNGAVDGLVYGELTYNNGPLGEDGKIGLIKAQQLTAQSMGTVTVVAKYVDDEEGINLEAELNIIVVTNEYTSQNIAPQATITRHDNNSYEVTTGEGEEKVTKTVEANPQSAIDNNVGNYWFCDGDNNLAAGTEITHFFVLDFEDMANIDMMELLWEGAIAADYAVYITTFEEDITDENYDSVVWNCAYERKNIVSQGVGDWITHQAYFHPTSQGEEADAASIVNAAVRTRYVKVETTKNATSYGVKLIEFRTYGITDDKVTGVDEVSFEDANAPVNVYTIDGRVVRRGVSTAEATIGLERGIYIVGNKKIAIR